jgi:phosphoenolpyruvate carboxylase
MARYAELVEDKTLRDHYLQTILDEFRLSEEMINEVFGAPRDQRRPRMMKTLHLRESGLRALHERQIHLLREWRRLRDAEDAGADRLLPSLLLSINAIASGQRVTG